MVFTGLKLACLHPMYLETMTKKKSPNFKRRVFMFLFTVSWHLSFFFEKLAETFNDELEGKVFDSTGKFCFEVIALGLRFMGVHLVEMSGNSGWWFVVSVVTC